MKAQQTNHLINPSDKFFIAGATGMAGGSIVRALTRAGYGKPTEGGALITPTRNEVDLLEAESVDDWFRKNSPSVVVLAAAVVGGIEANRSKPTDFLLNNLKLQNNVIEAAWRHGSKRLLFLGSSCIYPKFAQQPICEEALLSGGLEPTNEWYAIAKIAGLKLCEALRKQHGFDAISLMPTNLYGPGDNYDPAGSHVLPALIRRFQEAKETGQSEVTCWGSGTPRREFLHADDLGDACVFALQRWNPEAEDAPKDGLGQPLAFLNVGTGIDLSIKSLAQQVADAVGYMGTIHWDTNKPDGTPKKQLDVSRLAAMGWKAKIDFKDGLPMAVTEYLDRRRKGELRCRAGE